MFFSATCLAVLSSAITLEIEGDDAQSPAYGLDRETFGQTDSTGDTILDIEAGSKVTDECCQFFPGSDFEGEMQTVCLKDMDAKVHNGWKTTKSNFIKDYKFVNSYKCGKSVKLSLCKLDAKKFPCESNKSEY